MTVLPLSRWLAEQTLDLHRSVEDDLLPAGRITSFGDVVQLVSAHGRVLTRYADQLDAVVSRPAGAPVCRWRAAAQADLLAWGDLEAARTTTGAEAPQPSGDPVELVGVRYVLEGARVGLRVLAQQVQDSARAAGAAPSRLFAVEPDAGHRWRRAREWLDGPENGQLDRELVLSGAREAFAAYGPDA